jgi:hypothetical protein
MLKIPIDLVDNEQAKSLWEEEAIEDNKVKNNRWKWTWKLDSNFKKLPRLGQARLRYCCMWVKLYIDNYQTPVYTCVNYLRSQPC